jgi:hypothetical protein
LLDHLAACELNVKHHGVRILKAFSRVIMVNFPGGRESFRYAAAATGNYKNLPGKRAPMPDGSAGDGASRRMTF